MVAADVKLEWLRERISSVNERDRCGAELVRCVFVPGMCHYPGTNNLGRVQRRIVAYLGTAPFGFYAIDTPLGYYDGEKKISAIDDPRVAALRRDYPNAAHALEHGPPIWASVLDITTTVYGTADPTPAQTRATQRAVRQLEQRGLAECRMGCARTEQADSRSYTTRLGYTAWQPTPALYARLPRWSCRHVKARQHRLKRTYLVARREEEVRRAELAGLTPAEAIGRLMAQIRGA